MALGVLQAVENWPDIFWVRFPNPPESAFVNRAWETITGSPRSSMSVEPDAWLKWVHPDDLPATRSRWDEWLARGAPTQLTMKYRFRNAVHDDYRWVLSTASATHRADGGIELLSGLTTDIDEAERNALSAEQAATHDWLTDLLNRRGFLPEVQAALDDCEAGIPAALLLLDLDGFKAINDLYGHLAGDSLLLDVAHSLHVVMDNGSTSCRLGGDEFAVLLRNTQLAEALAKADRLVRAISEIQPTDPTIAVTVRASIGVAELHPTTRMSVDDVIGRADLALYEAKGLAPGGVFAFPAGGSEAARTLLSRPTWGRRIYRAFEEDLFILHAQPIVRLSDGAITGFELLLRLHDVDGDVSAAKLMEHIRRLGRNRHLDHLVIRRVGEILRHHGDALAGRQLTVNLSATALNDPTILEAFRGILGTLPGQHPEIMVEVTEREAIVDTHLARRVSTELQGMGLKLALDDFGTGYGSPGLLREVPFDVLKIEGRFVAHSLSNQTDEMIVRYASELAASLGILSVAEGIETAAIADHARGLGISHGQGYLFGRPASLDSAFRATSAWRPSD